MIFKNLTQAMNYSRGLLLDYGQVISTKNWQGVAVNKPMLEELNVNWSAPIPNSQLELERQTKPDLPWAENHFQERVGGEPLNPGKTYKDWPGYKNVGYNDKNFRKDYTDGLDAEPKFSHTYMERYWPKEAGMSDLAGGNNNGIRYKYGDLMDVVNLLKKDPDTRQAYLPIWFPEDTGVLHGGRVPCSLGYHFIIRNKQLYVHYTLRSCDMVRHFRNDVYLTSRLAQWVCEKIYQSKLPARDNVTPGLLTMNIISLHCFYQEKNLI